MRTLRDRLASANRRLAPYAVPHGGGLGRDHPEKDDATRFPFQRDRDRILHTQAFRRLKHKTQVFVSGHGDHYRTRITHTLEVAQVSRDIARTLGLNEDLAEAIALAHDLGHTPFGHAGEEAMRDCMRRFGKSFEHNEQSLRIVTLLESRTKHYPGLNLSYEILEGLMKHPTSLRSTKLRGAGRSLSLEAQVVNLADEIAYTAHDTDDGLRAGMFTLKNVASTRLGARAARRAQLSGTEVRGALVDLLVSDIYKAVPALLKAKKVKSLSGVYAAEMPLVRFLPAMHSMLTELRKFLWKHLYLSPAVQRQAGRGKRIITRLFHAYMEHPPAKVLELTRRHNCALEDAVKDYIAGMTDTYASELADRL